MPDQERDINTCGPLSVHSKRGTARELKCHVGQFIAHGILLPSECAASQEFGCLAFMSNLDLCAGEEKTGDRPGKEGNELRRRREKTAQKTQHLFRFRQLERITRSLAADLLPDCWFMRRVLGPAFCLLRQPNPSGPNTPCTCTNLSLQCPIQDLTTSTEQICFEPRYASLWPLLCRRLIAAYQRPVLHSFF